MDELVERYGSTGIPLPAILIKKRDTPEVMITAAEINACGSMAELKPLIAEKLDAARRTPEAG